MNEHVLCDLIRQGEKLGAKSVVLAGAGEPLLDSAFPAVAETAAALGITTVLYTNGSQITPKVAQFLFEHDVSICLKLDTLDEGRFDGLTDIKGAYRQTMHGLENLLARGYGMPMGSESGFTITRLAINAVVTRANLPDLVDLARFCAQHRMKLFLDNLSLAGRAMLNWRDLATTPAEYTQICTDINSDLGCEAVGHSLDRADACILWKYGVVIYLDGEARVCYDDLPTPRIGNIRDASLEELVRAKQTLHPPIPSNGDCLLKCVLRQRLWQSVQHLLPPSEAIACFGTLTNL